jgi:uncharacterized membrane protein YdjX (TVP38/TMEM64 family)
VTAVEGPASAPARPGHLRFWVAVGLLTALLVAAHAFHVHALLAAAARRAHAVGPWGLAVVGLLYVPAALVGLPCAPLTFAAGYVFGPAAAAAVGVLGNTAGACSAFGAGRLLAGDARWIEEGKGRIARAARALAGRRGFWTVVILRISPVTPFGVLNYTFALTPIHAGAYALATLVGSVPAAVAFAVAGAFLGGKVHLPGG